MRSLQRRSPQQYTLSPRRADTDGPPDAYALVLRDVQDHVRANDARRTPALSDRFAANLAPEQFVATIRDKSEGNFLYVRYLLQMMLDRQRPITLESLAAVPAGLDDIYLEFVQRLVPSGAQVWHSEYGKVLGVLAVGQVPLTEDQIANFTALSPTAARVALQNMRELLETNESRQASQREYSLYHPAPSRISCSTATVPRSTGSTTCRCTNWSPPTTGPPARSAGGHATTTACATWRPICAGRETARLQSLVDEDWIRRRYVRGPYATTASSTTLNWPGKPRSRPIESRSPTAIGPRMSRRTFGGRSLSPASAASPPVSRPTCSARSCAEGGCGPPSKDWPTRGACRRGSHAARRSPASRHSCPKPLRTEAFAESTAAARQIPAPSSALGY